MSKDAPTVANLVVICKRFFFARLAHDEQLEYGRFMMNAEDYNNLVNFFPRNLAEWLAEVALRTDSELARAMSSLLRLLPVPDRPISDRKQWDYPAAVTELLVHHLEGAHTVLGCPGFSPANARVRGVAGLGIPLPVSYALEPRTPAALARSMGRA